MDRLGEVCGSSKKGIYVLKQFQEGVSASLNSPTPGWRTDPHSVIG